MIVYILKLEQGKYYVGKTTNLNDRLIEHFDGQGCDWTRKYKPINIVKFYKNCSSFDEDRYVKEYMSIYGINNVRGGSYVKEILTEEERILLNKEIRGAKDKCFKCGSNEHWARDCEENEETNSRNISQYVEIYSDNFYKISRNVCYRCGRDSHWANRCYATYDIDGHRL